MESLLGKAADPLNVSAVEDDGSERLYAYFFFNYIQTT